MSRHTMPFLVVNYGAEMVFILDQRLQAQNVPPEKGSKVLQDVVRAMFAPTFVDELMRPQPMYTASATKEIFYRLAHSSIMRLSDNSMDKLYDLMTMGCKYQYVTLRHPYELVELTLNHLDHMKQSLSSAGDGNEDLRAVETKLRALCKTLTCGELADIRHQLLNFFQSRRVKVSLFLQEGMQNSDATLNIPADTSIPPLATCEAPGAIRYFDQGALVLQESFAHPAGGLTYRTPPESYSPLEPSARMCTQGKNLYLIDRKKKGTTNDSSTSSGATAKQPTAGATGSSAATSSSHHAAADSVVRPVQVPPPSGPTPPPPSLVNYGHMTTAGGGTAALNSLSSLIVGSGSVTTTGHFKLNLFNDANDDDPRAPDSAAGDGAFDVAAPVIQISQLTNEEVRRNNAELVGVLGGFSAVSANSHAAAAAKYTGGGGGDDLLDLMDSA